MADVNSVVEEKVKFRDGKKWKSRWCVLKKPSPVADRMQVLLYKCMKDALKGETAKADFFLEDFYGLETGFSYEKENNVLAIICHRQVTTFAFDSRESLIKFEIKIRTAIGEEHQFPVHVKRVPPQSKLPLEKMRMHIHGPKFCLTQQCPPKITASWIISDLRKFGKLEGKFVFEGGSRCGKGAGVHILQSDQLDVIEEIIQLASQGKTASGHKSNKRRSQNCDYLDPVTKFASGNLYKNNVPTSPGSYNSRSWRHSFSASNSGWSSSSNFGLAANYSYNSRLRSIENLEREKLMALYDVPPRRIRKVESPRSPRLDHQTASSLQHSPHMNMSDERPDLDYSSSSLSLASCESSPAYLGCKASVSASAPALCGYGAYSPFNDKYKNMSCSVPDHIDELEELDRQEALDCLQREERGLQREISLLDEMLQGCQRDDPRRGRNKRDKNKPPPIPRKVQKSSRRPENLSFNHGAFFHDNTLLSPNLFSKLKRIPSNSKLSAPLPYVNLEKYDIGDVDNSHVHVPSSCADSGNWSAPCVSSGKRHGGRRSGPNKENVKGSPRQHRNNVNCLRGKSSSESELSCRSASGVTKEENIYANEFPRPESPPALPPKGPALLKLMRGRNNSDHPPPVPPHRPWPRKSATSQGVEPSSMYQCPRSERQINPEILSGPTDSYLLMDGFEKEEKQPNRDINSETENCREVVKLPTRKVVGKSDRPQQNAVSPQGAYMEMGTLFQNENEFQARQCLPEARTRYERSYSASDALDDDKPSSSCVNQSYITVSNSSLIREENYLLMSNFHTPKKSDCDSLEFSQRRPHQSVDLTAEDSTLGLTKNVSDTSFGSDTSDIDNTAIPFPNLMNFQQHAITNSATKSSRNSTCGPTTSVQTSEGSGRNPGFLTRLIRRNSGNRKSMSQSQENLLASSSSESCLERTMNQSSKEPVLRRVLSQSSDSSSSSCGQHPSPTLSLSDHRRSASFPNRASFFDQPSPVSDKARGLHQGNQGNYFSALSLDDEMQLLECDNEFTGSDSSSLNDVSKGGRSQSGYRGPCESTGSENGDDDCEHLSEKQNQKLLLCSKHKKHRIHEAKVFTTLQSDPRKLLESESDSSSKTDDEKLIELFKQGSKSSSFDDQELYKVRSSCTSEYKKRQSLPTDGRRSLSPKEEALAIVKHVSSLAPFIPPKLKHYPCPLSPVPESVPSPCRGDSPPSSRSSRSVVSSCAGDMPRRGHVDPVFQKELARATLRIQPPPPLIEEEEEENVWVPRDSTNSQEGTNAVTEDKFKALVVEVEEDCDEDAYDTISMSSLDSSLASCEEARTSPASTLLRPRSGKEYKMVERRRQQNDSLSSSPAQTPQSPSDTVFTFESFSPSQTSVFSRERESPNGPKFTRTDSSVSTRIYERISPPRTYMNIDMTPPSSPLYPMSLPPEQIEPQLNYAEIDLSHSSNTKSSKKSRKASQKSSKSSTIEYALIDMEATVAIQRAGREHVQSREDSLRRSEKKLSLCNREPKLSVSETGLGPAEHAQSPDQRLQDLDRTQKERSPSESPERRLRESPERRLGESPERSLRESPERSHGELPETGRFESTERGINESFERSHGDLELPDRGHGESTEMGVNESFEQSLGELPGMGLRESPERNTGDAKCAPEDPHFNSLPAPELPERGLRESPERNTLDAKCAPEDPHCNSLPAPELPERGLRESPERKTRDAKCAPEDPHFNSLPVPELPEATLLPERRTSYTSSSSSDEEEY